MVNNTIKIKPSNICFQCGSELIFVSQETVQVEGARFQQINTVYRCSNSDCQRRKDKEKADRLKIRQNREASDIEKAEKIQEMRKSGSKPKH